MPSLNDFIAGYCGFQCSDHILLSLRPLAALKMRPSTAHIIIYLLPVDRIIVFIPRYFGAHSYNHTIYLLNLLGRLELKCAQAPASLPPTCFIPVNTHCAHNFSQASEPRTQVNKFQTMIFSLPLPRRTFPLW